MLKKIVIANRGEIACRIIKTAHNMGITTVAIFSKFEHDSKHVHMADEAYCLPSESALDVYLNGQGIIELTKRIQAQAIHPGYGFLSENAEFAQACTEQNVIFIGPSAKVIEQMGHKAHAKAIMAKAGVPILEGFNVNHNHPQELKKHASKIGYPLLIKAVHGGGGKGMRIVHQESELDAAMNSSRSEAKNYFGKDDLIIERFIEKPRHIEVQILADQFGACLYLGDRDCSIQRRHQKIIEEAPAPHLSNKLRKAMRKAALASAKTLNYTNAGTLEFLVDEHENFYFMEMNTRLQVEHPVTEMVHNIDLVAWQIKVSSGIALPQPLTEHPAQGHAIEVRIYAEDPNHNFMPCTGKISHLNEPKQKHWRIDSGLICGQNILPFYDPMLSKLIVWGKNRMDAIRSLHLALSQYQISGCQHNIGFLSKILEEEDFQQGILHTKFIPEHTQLFDPIDDQERHLTALFAATCRLLTDQTRQATSDNPWASLSQWRLNQPQKVSYDLIDANKRRYQISFVPYEQGFHVSMQALQGFIQASLDQNILRVSWQEQHYQIPFHHTGDYTTLYFLHQDHSFHSYQYEHQLEQSVEDPLHAPMNGTIVTHLVTAGDHVKSGDHLLVLEAMKMEYTIKAPFDGQVQCFYFEEGDQVPDGSKLLDMEAAS